MSEERAVEEEEEAVGNKFHKQTPPLAHILTTDRGDKDVHIAIKHLKKWDLSWSQAIVPAFQGNPDLHPMGNVHKLTKTIKIRFMNQLWSQCVIQEKDLPMEPDLRYPLRLMGRNGQTVGAPASRPIKERKDMNKGQIVHTISLHLNHPVGKSTELFPAYDDKWRRKQRRAKFNNRIGVPFNRILVK
ncbi:hypothetical protein LXL04_039777 [Taraxacum kok-saghyz]